MYLNASQHFDKDQVQMYPGLVYQTWINLLKEKYSWLNC